MGVATLPLEMDVAGLAYLYLLEPKTEVFFGRAPVSDLRPEA